jgi:hypothetical protein
LQIQQKSRHKSFIGKKITFYPHGIKIRYVVVVVAVAADVVVVMLGFKEDAPIVARQHSRLPHLEEKFVEIWWRSKETKKQSFDSNFLSSHSSKIQQAQVSSSVVH